MTTRNSLAPRVARRSRDRVRALRPAAAHAVPALPGVPAGPSVAVVLGTRPEGVKLAPLVRALAAAGARPVLISTGQHRDLLREILDDFGLAPDHDLDLMQPGQTLDHVLARALTGVGQLFDELGPAAVVVQGDTTSAMASGIAAFHRRIPVAHVEAGLRSHRLDLPFPEEMNRRALGAFATWHFAPTPGAVANLRREGITAGVHLVGNTVVDALRHIRARERPVPAGIGEFLADHQYVLATAHRRESWGAPIRSIARGLARLLDAHPELRLVFVTHPNPLAHDPVAAELAGLERALVLDAVDYRTFVRLLGGATLAVTDSGGVQEEAPTMGVPVLVTRDVTERPEGVEAGAALLVGTATDAIAAHAGHLLAHPGARRAMAEAGRSLYGDGEAARRIAEIMVRELRRDQPELAREGLQPVA